MKRIKIFIFIFLAGSILISCGNKNEKNVLNLKKYSREKAIDAYVKLADEYFMYSSIKDNGSMEMDFSLKEFINNTKQKENEFNHLKKPNIFEMMFKDGGGLNVKFINDKKQKAITYSYTAKTAIKDMEELNLFTVKFGDKDIEAASPIIIDKTFTLPTNGIGKLMALISPENFLSYLNTDFSYKAMTAAFSIKPDRHSQKRYDKAEKAMYKNAEITQTDTGYKIIFDNKQLKEVPAMFWYALKNDNRLKFFIDLYEKIVFSAEVKNMLQNLSPDKINIPDSFKLIEELTVKNGLITEGSFKLLDGDAPKLKVNYKMGNYEHIFNDLQFSIEANDTPIQPLNISFMTKGNSDNSKIAIDAVMKVNNPSLPNKKEAADMNWKLFLDKAKAKDNFKFEMTMNTNMHPVNMSLSRSMPNTEAKHQIETVSIKTSGDFIKTENSVEYSLNKLEIQNPYNPLLESLSTDINSKFIISDKIKNEVIMPSEKIKVLETKSEEWTKIQNEAMMNIQRLSQKIQ